MSQDKPAPTYITMPLEDFAERCNGPEAYSDHAPAMLSAAVIREQILMDRIARLEHRLELVPA